MSSFNADLSSHQGQPKMILSRLTKKKERKHVIGQIDSSVFSYITPLMIIVATIVLVIIGGGIETLLVYFNTNVALNGLIIFLIVLALFTIFYNNFVLYKTACFIKDIEKAMEHSVIKDSDVNHLHQRLERDVPLLNTKNMQDCIANLSRFGHPNFTDKDAMIIKSKLGYRLGLKRSDSNFNAGILVMLGLLGTFLGLLKTIDAVGGALNSMSSIGGDGGEITMETMSNFIGSLAAPLNGMGLAFSSSLFGLSGSLLVGFFSHLSTGAQNNFIENASRWIDNRIPKFDPDKSKKDPSNKQANQDDLKHWLAGYVHLSVKTNKQLAHLSQTILNSIEQADATRMALTSVAGAQEQLTQKLDMAMQDLSALNKTSGALISGITQSHETLVDMRQAIDVNTQEIGTKLDALPTSLSESLNHSLSDTIETRLSNVLVSPLDALNSSVSHLEQTITQGHSALLVQLQDKTADQEKNSKIDLQTAALTRLETMIQTHLSYMQADQKTEAISTQLQDICSSLLVLDTTLKEQSQILSDMPVAASMPAYSPSLHSNQKPQQSAIPPIQSDTAKMQEDVKSMLDDIQKDEDNFFKNFFGINHNKDEQE